VALAQVARLQEQRAALTAERDRLAAELAARYSGGQQQDAWVLQPKLLAVDTRLGELERTLDSAVAIVAGDTERAKKRRTQAAAQALANSRLAAMAAELQRRLPGLAQERIVLRPPRGVPVDGLDAGGRVIATVRASTAP
jgi:hypothetical protein